MRKFREATPVGPGGWPPGPPAWRRAGRLVERAAGLVQPLERVLGRLVVGGVEGLLEEGDDVAHAVRRGHVRVRRVQQRRRRMSHERLEAAATQLERVEQAGRPGHVTAEDGLERVTRLVAHPRVEVLVLLPVTRGASGYTRRRDTRDRELGHTAWAGDRDR